MAYLFRLNKSVPEACRLSLPLQIIYNYLKQYNGQEFDTIDDFYLKARRGAVQAITKLRDVLDYRLLNNCFSLTPESGSEDRIVGCIPAGMTKGCNFGRLEKLVN